MRTFMPQICAHCKQDFVPKPRVSGGGQIAIYCSRRCGHAAYCARHPERRKEIVKRSASKPEQKTKKAITNRNHKIRQYGWTPEEFFAELERQNYRCLGCLKTIDELSARIDHDHQSKIIRGLLCDGCNWVLGHAKDSQATLRRLMAYLDRDRTKQLLYLGGALKNPRIPEIGIVLRKQGFDVMDEWFTPGEHADTNWQAYEKLRGRSYVEALRGRAATNIFLFDRSYIELSDIFVLVMPAGKSGMLELGYAKGIGKETYILLDGNEPERYDVMPNAADGVFNTLEELINALQLQQTNATNTSTNIVPQVRDTATRIHPSIPLLGISCGCPDCIRNRRDLGRDRVLSPEMIGAIS